MAKAVRLIFSEYSVGIRVTARLNNLACVLREIVAQLVFLRRFKTVKHSVFRRNINSVLLRYIFGNEGF